MRRVQLLETLTDARLEPHLFMLGLLALLAAVTVALFLYAPAL